jgi:hypothetical protein
LRQDFLATAKIRWEVTRLWRNITKVLIVND